MSQTPPAPERKHNIIIKIQADDLPHFQLALNALNQALARNPTITPIGNHATYYDYTLHTPQEPQDDPRS